MNFLISQETSYILGSNIPSSKNEKNRLLETFLYFGEMELSSPKLKNLLYFTKELAKSPKQTKNLLRRISCLL